MLRLVVTAAIIALGLASAAQALSPTITIKVAKGNDLTFNNNPIGAMSGNSTAFYDGAPGPISFVAGADTTGVTIGTSGNAAEPFGDISNYLWGLHDGTTVNFGNAPVHSFLIHWGSVDALAGDGYDNVLTLSNGHAVTGTDLVGLGLAVGDGSQTNPANNRWLWISDTTPFSSFTATSPKNAFEFDMSVPEPSTWAMMLIGFGALGVATRRQRRTQVVTA